MNALIELFKQFWEELRPWALVSPWESSIRVRLGKYTTECLPGIHFKIPVFDSFHNFNVVPRVANLPHQSLKTADGKNIALSGALAYYVSDAEKAVVEGDDFETALINIAMGLLADYVANHPASECTHDAIQASVADSLHNAAEAWGLDITHVYLVDLADVKTFRLLQDTQSKQPTITIT